MSKKLLNSLYAHSVTFNLNWENIPDQIDVPWFILEHQKMSEHEIKSNRNEFSLQKVQQMLLGPSKRDLFSKNALNFKA